MSSIKKLTVLLIVALLVVSIIIFDPFRSEPPAPDVTVNGSDIPTTQGSYCWRSIFSGSCVDFVYSNPIEMAQKHKPTAVSPQGEVKINFSKEPLSGTLEVEQWLDTNNSENIKLENGTISAPEAKGVYVYHIQARWKQGDGNYAFSIEVK